MKGKGVLIVIGLVAVLLVCGVGYGLYSGMIKLPTVQTQETETSTDPEYISMDMLGDNQFYVWHHEGVNIDDDIKSSSIPVTAFAIGAEGDKNWNPKDDDSFEGTNTVFFKAGDDDSIPTLRVARGDKLLYVSPSNVPWDNRANGEQITWNRLSDNGYSIGVVNMTPDAGGHYRIFWEDKKKKYKTYVYDKSDAAQLNEFNTTLYLDKAGGVQVIDGNITSGGAIKGLEKGKKYRCTWYNGTYYQDFDMTADVRSFTALEQFATTGYNFLHSSCVEITIPDWVKSGYYCVNGTGIFRYVAAADDGLYSGASYDTNINWNDPIILKDSENRVIYDPSLGIDRRNEALVSESGNETIYTAPASENSDNTETDTTNDDDLARVLEERISNGEEFNYDDTGADGDPGLS